jgi:ABC-type lipoprotein export system ATPase subunit
VSALTDDRAIATTDLVVDHRTEHGVVRALRSDPLLVAGGESVAIMGPSGCGKSTLLGLLGGLAVPTEGTVEVGGEAVSALEEAERIRFRRRAVGMVYQSDNLLPHLTVTENVALQLAITREDRGNSAAMDPGALLERLGLTRLVARLPDELSGGERQRVAVARAIVHRPRVILADEPTGSLDPANARIVLELLLEVQSELGATLILVTHDPAIAGHLGRLVRLQRPAVDGHAH